MSPRESDQPPKAMVPPSPARGGGQAAPRAAGRGPSPVLILGTGAMAKLLGARLARAGCRVSLAGTWPEALAEMGEAGIEVEEAGSVWTAPVKTIDLRQQAGDAASPRYVALPEAAFDLVLVLVKSHQTASVAPAAAQAVAASGLILSLQNGLGNQEALEGAGPEATVLIGVTVQGATGLGPARVRSGGPGSTTIGLPNGIGAAQREVLEALLERFRESGMEAELSENLSPLLWRKLVVNCGINPLTAILGWPNGRLLEDPRAQTIMAAAAREAAAVAEALEIDLGLGDADPASLAEDVARRTAPNRSSMLQDIDRGAKTEIDAICGPVIREGAGLGLPTPVCRWLQAAVERAEEAGSFPAQEVLIDGQLYEGALLR